MIEGHTHTEDCCGYEETLICGEEEQQEISEPHRHTEACYTREFVCTKSEHTHSLICYSDKFADLESAGEWEATIPELTGETAGENVALAAKSQIGYTQSGRNYEVDDAGSKHGYTRYGAWYGYPYSEWCAMFASFCLHYAGVAQADVPYAAGCVYWTERLEDAGLYKNAGDYTPKTGDLVFFDTDGDGASDHVGIVTELRGETMETVEGNVGGEVVEKRHELTDEDVFGFGALPQDEAPADVPVIDEPENPTPAEENPDEAMDENPEEKPDEEAPDENPDEEEPEETTRTRKCRSLSAGWKSMNIPIPATAQAGNFFASSKNTGTRTSAMLPFPTSRRSLPIRKKNWKRSCLILRSRSSSSRRWRS